MNLPNMAEGATGGGGVAESICKLERVLLLGITAALPLAYAPRFLNDPYNMPKLTLLVGIVGLALGLRIGAGILGAPWTHLRILLVPAAVLGLAFIASWSASDYKAWSLLGLYMRYSGLIPYLAVIVFGVLAADAFAGRGERLLYGLLVGAVLVAMYGIIQMVFMGNSLATRSDTSYVVSTLGHSNFLGGYLAMMLPLALGVWVMPGRPSRFGMAATIVISTCLIFTMSQGGWAAGVAGVAAFIGLANSASAWKKFLGLGTAVAVAAVPVGAVVASMLIPHPSVRLPSALATATTRGFLWEAALAVGMQKPLLGSGPNVHAIEGPLNRVLENALALNFTMGDDPHSVPLAMFANVGLIGLVAWLFLFAWTWRTWRRAPRSRPMHSAAAAAIVAYFVQALVSIDELTLRMVLWALVAAIAAFVQTSWSCRRSSAASNRAPWAALAVAAGILSLVASVFFLSVADYRAREGALAFSEDETAAGREHFLAALALRPDNTYKRQYAAALNRAALKPPSGGEALIREMKQTMSYLDDFPDPQALAGYSKLLNRWSLFDPRANVEALAIARRAQEYDQHNPLLAVDIADILLQLERPVEAARELAPIEELLTDDFPEYSYAYAEFWGAVAMTRAELGEFARARTALQRVPTGSCRHLITLELLKFEHARMNPPALSFVCPATLIRLLPQS